MALFIFCRIVLIIIIVLIQTCIYECILINASYRAELNPEDPSSYNLLGRWCKGIVEINWVTKRMAAAIFGSLPATSYEEALSYFQRAESLAPGTWLKNQTLIVECLIGLNRYVEAKQMLDKCQHTPVRTAEDKDAKADIVVLRGRIR